MTVYIFATLISHAKCISNSNFIELKTKSI